MEHTGVNGASGANEVGCLDASININVVTLNSRSYTLRVNKQISLVELKEQITSLTGVPAEHQRLLYRGRVLSDDRPLSTCQVEGGQIKLHLVTRVPAPPTNSSTQPASASASTIDRHIPVSSGGMNQDVGVHPIVTHFNAFHHTIVTERVQPVDLQQVQEGLNNQSSQDDYGESAWRLEASLHLLGYFVELNRLMTTVLYGGTRQVQGGLLNQSNQDDHRANQRTQIYAQRMEAARIDVLSYLLDLGLIMRSMLYDQNQPETAVNDGRELSIFPSGPSSLGVQPRSQQGTNFGTTNARETGGTRFHSANGNGRIPNHASERQTILNPVVDTGMHQSSRDGAVRDNATNPTTEQESVATTSRAFGSTTDESSTD